jgi:hypothetical protein
MSRHERYVPRIQGTTLQRLTSVRLNADVDLQVFFDANAPIIDISSSSEPIRVAFELFEAMGIVSDVCPRRSSSAGSSTFHIRMNEANVHAVVNQLPSNFVVKCYMTNLSFRYAL